METYINMSIALHVEHPQDSAKVVILCKETGPRVTKGPNVNYVVVGIVVRSTEVLHYSTLHHNNDEMHCTKVYFR